MDNTGAYLTYCELLLSMSIAGNTKVVKSKLTLTGGSTDPSGDTFTFAKENAGDQDPQVGDAIHQAGKVACIASFPSATEIKLDTTGTIVNGPADLLHSETIPKSVGEALIMQASERIDQSTGQFFNKRSGVFKIEGNNTALMHLSVPIIEIEKLLINSSDTELKEGEDYDYVAFKGRQQPQDDRRNPRIKLNIGNGRGSIYSGSLTSRKFLKGTLTELTGSFGFLEADGSTPQLIKRAVNILVMEDINTPVGSSLSASDGAGPLKRIKVDLHEQEFFESSSNKDSVKSSASGNEEVDRIIAMYRTPIRLGGSFISHDSGEY